ncbi:MAG: phosphotransferase [Clostridiales bacterium]|nr:phosphotransferase [Clostridiales bacterium]
MASLNSKTENGVLTLCIAGRVDSTNAAQLENEINLVTSEGNYSSVIIDASELEYISSAGLRIILRLKKNNPSLKIINVSSEVYEILDMTGFTEMMTVEKAYRVINVDGCEVIGKGANGEVYRIDPDTIVKVYLNPDSLSDIQRERELARRAFVLGIPTAIPYDVVKVGSDYGSVFELLNAKSFAKLIASEPENIDKYIEMYIDLAKKIHSTAVKPGDMPSMKQEAMKWATYFKGILSDEQTDKLIKLVNDVPDDMNMLHGDYHVKNAMMQNGEILLIDMDTLCHGNPVFELSAMYNAYVGFTENHPEIRGEFLGISASQCEYIWQKSKKLYFGTDDTDTLKEKEDKIRLVSYMRIARRIRKRLDMTDEKVVNDYNYYISALTNLLEKVDSIAL